MRLNGLKTMKKDQIKKGIQITKLDAALRQLETAITLWFNSGDSLSIHTLSSAAYQILYDINKHQNGPTMTPDTDIIKPEKQAEWKRALKAPANFLKHADTDPTDTIFFNSAVNEHILFEATIFYSIITKETRPVLFCFHQWMLINESVWFKREHIDRVKKRVPIDHFRKFEKGEFFRKMLPNIISTIGSVHQILP
jgi:hypothetical protein